MGRPSTRVLSAVLGASLLASAAFAGASCDRNHDRVALHGNGECVTCHRADYDGTASTPNGPPHALAGFPTTCVDCHNTIAWRPAASAHPWWLLDGAHATLECANACHNTNYRADPTGPRAWRFAGTPTECDGCHTADRTDADTRIAGHSGYSLQCQNCHNTTTWTGAMEHPETLFPITTGRHAGIACADCHNAALGATNSVANTDCVDCHTTDVHTPAQQNGNHGGVSMYLAMQTTYPKNFCVHCHWEGTRTRHPAR